MLFLKSTPAVLNALGVDVRISRIHEVQRMVDGQMLVSLRQLSHGPVCLPQVGDHDGSRPHVLLDDGQKCVRIALLNGYHEALRSIA